MTLCARTAAVGASWAKGLEKGSKFLINGCCRERVGEGGFQCKACHLNVCSKAPKIPGNRLLFLGVSSRNSAKGLEVFGVAAAKAL